MVETFVKNVYVHDINRIEVVYVTEDIITKVIRRNNAVFDEEFAEADNNNRYNILTIIEVNHV